MVNVAAWILFTPHDDGRSDYARQVLGEMVGSTAVILFAISLLLSTRSRFLEPAFGGLDKMYRSHKEVSVVGFLLLCLHVVSVPWRLEPGGGVPAGLIAFFGFLILVVLTVGPRLSLTRTWVTLGYRNWKRTHRLTGLFFIFSCAHVFLVDPLATSSGILVGLVVAAYALGIASYLYNLLLARFVRPIGRYLVEEVHRLTETATEVVLSPRKQRVPHRAGQFVFVRFSQRGLREAHPFTVASGPGEGSLRLVIKASGDFTHRLADVLKPGRKAKVEGSYGMLDYRSGNHQQIWIAGGIGITPFLSWLRDLDGLDHSVDFFYAVRRKEDALYLDELQTAAAEHDRLNFHLNISVLDGTLTADRIVDMADGGLSSKSIYMCGPVPMLQAYEAAFRSSGVPARAIHYEEFSFR